MFQSTKCFKRGILGFTCICIIVYIILFGCSYHKFRKPKFEDLYDILNESIQSQSIMLLLQDTEDQVKKTKRCLVGIIVLYCFNFLATAGATALSFISGDNVEQKEVENA